MNKKIILFLLILVSICAISHVSAVDDSDILSNDLDDMESAVVEQSDIKSEDNQILTTTIDSKDTSFEDIKQSIESADYGETIYLNGSFEFKNTITISKSIKIIGTDDGATIKRDEWTSNIFSFFNIESTASNVVLNNLKFNQGSTAILWQGNGGNISKCAFVNCIADGGNGSAITLKGNNCNITDCTFTNNQARYGGAVKVEGTNNGIYHCQFNGNSFRSSNSSVGGAVYSACENMIIDYCNFTGNYVRDFGGAIFVSGKKNTISHSNFRENYITESNSSAGGAIFSNAEGLTINYCNFTRNHASDFGGAIILGENNFVMHSYFEGNLADKGNHIYSDYVSTVIENEFVINFNETSNNAVCGDKLITSNNNFTFIRIDSSIYFISTGIIFEYGTTSDPIRISVEGGKIEAKNIKVLNHPEAKIAFSNNILSVSNLAVGKYTLRVTTTPDENHFETYADLGITVKKATAVIKAEKTTVAYKKGYSWTIKLVNSKTGKAIANMELTLKVFTGKKYKVVKVKTNSKGEAKYQTRKLSIGSHKAIVTGSDKRYEFNTLSSSIKVIKQKPIKFKVKTKTANDGSQLSIQVFNKKTNKALNGANIKLLIYTGKKYKVITLKTKNMGKFKGICGYSTNMLSVGKHKVKIMSNTIKYGGSASSSMTITKKAKKIPPWETRDSA